MYKKAYVSFEKPLKTVLETRIGAYFVVPGSDGMMIAT